jgi:hypothetical protein
VILCARSIKWTFNVAVASVHVIFLIDCQAADLVIQFSTWIPMKYCVRCWNVSSKILWWGCVNIMWRDVKKPDSVTSITRQRLVKDHYWATLDKHCLQAGILKSESNRDVHCLATAQLAFSHYNQSLEIKSTCYLRMKTRSRCNEYPSTRCLLFSSRRYTYEGRFRQSAVSES